MCVCVCVCVLKILKVTLEHFFQIGADSAIA